MPKVLFVIDSLQTGGAEKSILAIASRLVRFEPVVCHLYENDFLKPDFEKHGIRVISLGIKGAYGFFSAYRKLKRILIEEKPDLVVATLLRSELISRMACKSTGIVNIGTFVNDTYSPFELQSLSMSMKAKIGFFWILNAATARFCKAFLSNSVSIRDSNCRALFIPRERVTVIYRGRIPGMFPFSTDRFRGPGIRFLAVGRLLARKGFAELIDAFAAYHEKNSQSTLSIAGEGPLRSLLENKIDQNNLKDSVVLLGNRSDVPSLMNSHDVFVFPSHYEGFSGTVVEAMFAGIPVVASDIAMNREAVTHTATARLFAVRDTSALRQEMDWITKHKHEALLMARNARQDAERRFDIAIIAAQHEAYYTRIMNEA